MTFGRFDGQVFTDRSDITPPSYGSANGGPLAVARSTVDYTDLTTKQLFTLPKGAVIDSWQVNVRTAFNSSGTDLLDIGDTSTGARFANDLNVATAGQLVTGFVPAELNTPLVADTIITAIFVQGVADASAGLADVACRYYLT